MASRNWPALSFRLSPSIAHSLLGTLDDCQITALDDTDECRWRVYFARTQDRDRALSLLRMRFPETDLQMTCLEVSDENWAARSQEGLGAVLVDRILVTPPWNAAASTTPESLLHIIVEPSTGFGTGHHPSTRQCLKLLQQVSLSGKTVIDIGTGSGILAVASLRRGARRVVAVDCDPQAIEAAADTLRRNDCSAVELRLGDFGDVANERADVLLANLTGTLLVRRALELQALMNPDSVAILAGFTTDDEEAVRAAFAPACGIDVRDQEADWVGLTLLSAPAFSERTSPTAPRSSPEDLRPRHTPARIE